MIQKIYSRHKENTHNYLWRALQVLGTQGTSFFIFYLCSRLFVPADFGIYNLVFATIFFLVIFCNFGISVAISKYAAEYNVTKKEDLPYFLSNAALLIIALSSLVALFVFLFGESLFPKYYHYIYYILPVLVLHPLYSLYDDFFNGLKRFKEQAIISLTTGTIICFIAFILIRKYGIYGALMAQNILYFVLVVVFAIRYGKFKLMLDIVILKKISQYAAIIGLTQTTFFFNRQVDILFLGHYNFITEIGYYAIAGKLLKILMVPFNILAQVISADVTKNFALANYAIVRKKFLKGISISVIVSMIIILVLFFTKDYLIKLFFPKYYTELMQHLLTLMLPVYFTQMVFGIVPRFTVSTGQAKWNLYFATIMGIMNVALDYVLINIFGFFGVIYSSWFRLIGCSAFIYIYYLSIKKAEING